MQGRPGRCSTWRSNRGERRWSPTNFATPRSVQIVVMADDGTLIAEQPGPNPLENGVVVASRNGAPLQALETPPQYTPLADARDHRLMAFRLLVRDFTTGVEQGTSPAPSFT